MSKHTPGPWLARTQHYGSEGKGTPYVSAGDTARVLCFMNLSGAYGGYAGQEQARADARLMAAAPGLLEALKGLVAVHPDKGNEALLQGLLDDAKGAIAQAEAQP